MQNQKVKSLVDLQKALKSKAKKCSGMTTEEIFSGLWLSVEAATAHLQKILADQTVKEQALRKLLEDWPVFPPFASLPDDIPETVLTYCLKTLQLKKSFEKVFDEVFFAKKGSFMGETAKP
jgi:hypothetical protein